MNTFTGEQEEGIIMIILLTLRTKDAKVFIKMVPDASLLSAQHIRTGLASPLKVA